MISVLLNIPRGCENCTQVKNILFGILIPSRNIPQYPFCGILYESVKDSTFRYCSNISDEYSEISFEYSEKYVLLLSEKYFNEIFRKLHRYTHLI